jgi:glycogen synthase
MRVLQLGPYPPPHGGVQTNLVAIRDFLRRRQIPCAVINLTHFRRAAQDEVYYPENALQVLWLLLRLRYDIIHLHFGGDLNRSLLALALVCSMLPGKKVVLTFHSGGYPASEAGQSARPRTLRGFIFRRLDRVIAVNPELVELFRRFGVDPRRTRLIYPYAFGGAAGEPLPEALASFFAAHQPTLLTVGLLEPEYDLPLQIDALGVLRERFPGAGLVIIGAGSLEPELRQLIQSKAYGGHILLCGDVPHGATLEAMAQAAVLLRTTLYDGDAISVREALQVGTPVIATDNGMRPAGVRLIPRQNLPALCRAIEECVGERVPRQAAREVHAENLEAVLKLYEELL